MGIASGMFASASGRTQGVATAASTQQAKACDFVCSIHRDPVMAVIALVLIAVAAWIAVQRRPSFVSNRAAHDASIQRPRR